MSDNDTIERLSAIRWQLVGLYPRLTRGYHRQQIAQIDDTLTQLVGDLEARRPRLVSDDMDIPHFLRPQAE